MTITLNKTNGEFFMNTVTNTKTNSIAKLVCTYNRVSDGALMAQVITLCGKKEFWKNFKVGA